MNENTNENKKEKQPILYGVWLPQIGWLKNQSEPVAFEIEEIATSTAERMGEGARVEFIDDSLVGLENQLLEAEKANSEIQKSKFSFSKILDWFNETDKRPGQ